jgi:hypothetical protein
MREENHVTFEPNRPTAPEPLDSAEPASFPTQPVVSAGPRAPLVKPKSSARALNAVLAIAAVVAIGGIAFAIGRTTAPVAAADPRGAFGGAFPNGSFAPDASGGPAGFPGGGQGAGLGLGRGLTVSGTVAALTTDTLTITTDSGQTIEVGLDTDTGYHAKSDATSADVEVGSAVEVEVEVDFGAGPGQANASPDASTVLGPAADVTVVE